MAEYIEREVTCADCIHYDICIFHYTGNENKKCVHFKNKADVVEVRHGAFGNCRFTDGVFYQEQCSVCGECTYDYDGNYCPYCGAKMDGKGEGE